MVAVAALVLAATARAGVVLRPTRTLKSRLLVVSLVVVDADFHGLTAVTVGARFKVTAVGGRKEAPM